MQFHAFQAVAVVPTRDAQTALERGSSLSVSAETVPITSVVRHTSRMSVRCDPESERATVARRYAVAAERRRLLTHALHSDRNDSDLAAAEFASEHAVTSRFVRLDVRELEDTQQIDPVAYAEAVAPAEGSAPTERPALGAIVDQLRVQAAAYRAKAIALNAKLGLLEAERSQLREASGELHAVREQLIEGSARIDHAIEEIGAVTAVELQLSTLR